jgi:hypothetical protein
MTGTKAAGQPGQDILDRTARTGQSGEVDLKISLDRSTRTGPERTGWQEHDRKKRTTQTGQLG